MPKNDDADTPISIRVPKDLRQQIKDYAEANKLYRAGSANLSGALILIAREFFAGNVAQSSVVTDSDNVAQSNLDIDSKINDAVTSAIANLRASINDELVDIKQAIAAIETNRSEATAPANFTQALLQRAKEVAPLKLKEVA